MRKNISSHEINHYSQTVDWFKPINRYTYNGVISLSPSRGPVNRGFTVRTIKGSTDIWGMQAGYIVITVIRSLQKRNIKRTAAQVLNE